MHDTLNDNIKEINAFADDVHPFIGDINKEMIYILINHDGQVNISAITTLATNMDRLRPNESFPSIKRDLKIHSGIKKSVSYRYNVELLLACPKEWEYSRENKAKRI